MILGFMQKSANGDPTYFREKILSGVGRSYETTHGTISLNPKIHTLRIDPHNRWKPGMSIQMVYRGPKYSILDHFNKGIPELERCVSIQRIKLTWIYKNAYVETNLPLRKIKGPHGEFNYYPAIWIDDKPMNQAQIELLAANDGFDSIYQFFKWFNKDFTGKILHFTDYRY